MTKVSAGNGTPTAVERYEKRAEFPLLLLGVTFLVAYGWPIVDPRLDPGLEETLRATLTAVWGAFAIDFAIRLSLAEQRARYLRSHWYDVVILLAPMLRPLRFLQVLAIARVLTRLSSTGLLHRVGVYVGGVAVASVVLGALAVLDAERGDPDANITSIADALWWAAVTVTTVGYGDTYPVTGQGRMVALVLMIVGTAVVGTATAMLAAWLVAHLESHQAPRSEPGAEDQ